LKGRGGRKKKEKKKREKRDTMITLFKAGKRKERGGGRGVLELKFHHLTTLSSLDCSLKEKRKKREGKKGREEEKRKKKKGLEFSRLLRSEVSFLSNQKKKKGGGGRRGGVCPLSPVYPLIIEKRERGEGKKEKEKEREGGEKKGPNLPRTAIFLSKSEKKKEERKKRGGGKYFRDALGPQIPP